MKYLDWFALDRVVKIRCTRAQRTRRDGVRLARARPRIQCPDACVCAPANYGDDTVHLYLRIYINIYIYKHPFT